MKSFRLYALPSAWSGAARLVDFGATFDTYNYSASDEQSDARAIASDWACIGNDLFSAARQVATSLGLR